MIYELLNGQVLFSKTAIELEKEVVFNGDETLLIIPRADGQANAIKYSTLPLRPKEVRLNRSAIVTMYQPTNEDALTAFDAALSGLILATDKALPKRFTGPRR